jgi:glycosidase
MAYSLLFSLPGTPVLFYGEEIGMGENLAVEGRMAVRTPMQWSDARNGGFSTAAPSKLPAPMVEGGYGPAHVNVQAQRRDPDSLHSVRQPAHPPLPGLPELGWGEFAILEQPHTQVMAHSVTWEDACLVALHNLTGEPVTVPLTMPDLDPGTRLVDLLVDGQHAIDDKGRTEVPLEAYGFRWLRVVRPDDPRLL